MTDILQTGQAWLASQLKTHASRDVIYKRGVSQVTVKATVGRTLLKVDDGFGGIRETWTDRDFLIDAADLVLDSAVTLPLPGDTIDDTLSGNGTFEVMAYGGEPCWRFSDPYGVKLRIHTKRTVGG